MTICLPGNVPSWYVKIYKDRKFVKCMRLNDYPKGFGLCSLTYGLTGCGLLQGLTLFGWEFRAPWRNGYIGLCVAPLQFCPEPAFPSRVKVVSYVEEDLKFEIKFLVAIPPSNLLLVWHKPQNKYFKTKTSNGRYIYHWEPAAETYKCPPICVKGDCSWQEIKRI